MTWKFLGDLAGEIDKDIKRAYDDTRKRPYPYQYKGPEKAKPANKFWDSSNTAIEVNKATFK